MTSHHLATLRRAWLLGAALPVALCLSDARAYDSICYEWADPTAPVDQLGAPGQRGCSPLMTARGRWRDPVWQLDEHRVLFRKAMLDAGLPESVFETFTIAVPTPRETIAGDSINGTAPQQLARLSPLRLDDHADVDRMISRGFALDELAQLPDFSYSLADWAAGNESCPIESLRGVDNLDAPRACHAFETHMGALNASHFPPQSDRWYQWMHQLALERAGHCADRRATAWSSSDAPAAARNFDREWRHIWRECEAEALALEAIAQHYLEDSWSSGHMWQRWGSSNLADIPVFDSTLPPEGPVVLGWNNAPTPAKQLMISEIVALYAGTIHGVDAALFETALGRGIPQTMADPICYPADEHIGFGRDGQTIPATGDMHAHDMLGDPLAAALFGKDAEDLHQQYDGVFDDDHTESSLLTTQRDALLGCGAASVRDVYDRLADASTFGAPTFGATNAPAPVGPADCAAPLVTAATLARGFTSDLFVHPSYKLAVANGAVVRRPPPDIAARSEAEYIAIRDTITLMARAQPTSVVPATLQWDDFIYTEREFTCAGRPCGWWDVIHTEPGAKLTFLGIGPNADYAPAPGQPPVLADPALPWDGADAARQALSSAFHRAHADQWCDVVAEDDVTALADRIRLLDDPREREDLCQVCTEIASRHVTPSCGGTALCGAIAPGSFTFAQRGDPNLVADAICGCTSHGFVSMPVSDAAPMGWGAPCVDAQGAPIDPPLGTVGGDVPYNFLWQPVDAELWQVTRQFTPNRIGGAGTAAHRAYGNLDWVYQRDGQLRGYVTWKGPHGRNLPEVPTRATTGTLTPLETADYARYAASGTTPDTYVHRGTEVFLDGKVLHDFRVPGINRPGPFVSGAAIRHEGGRRYLLAVTTTLVPTGLPDQLWSIELDVPDPVAVAVGTVTLPDGCEWDDGVRANTYFFNASATQASSVVSAWCHHPYSNDLTTTINGSATTSSRSGSYTTQVPLLVQVDWTSATSTTVTFEDPAMTDRTYTTHSEGSPSAASEAIDETMSVDGSPLAVDYVGDQRVVMRATASGAFHETDAYAAGTRQEAGHWTWTTRYTAGTFSYVAMAEGQELKTHTDGAGGSHTTWTRSGMSNAPTFLYVDLRYGEVLVVDRVDTSTWTGDSATQDVDLQIVEGSSVALRRNGHDLTTSASTRTRTYGGDPFANDPLSPTEGDIITRDGVSIDAATIPVPWENVGYERGVWSPAQYAISAAGEVFLSVAAPQPSGSAAYTFVNVLAPRNAAATDPALVHRLTGLQPRFRYLGLY